MNTCMICVLSVLVLLPLSHSGPLSGRLECPQCMHLGMKLINMPAMIGDRVNQILEPILSQYNNTACVGNKAASDMCPITAMIGTSVCDSFNVNITAIGMTAANLPDAGMEISVVMRSCGVLMSGDTPKCTPILDLVEAGQRADVLFKLSLLSAQYKTVTYNGLFCQSVNGFIPTPIITDTATMAPLPTVSRVTVSNTEGSDKHTFDKGNSGNNLGLASNLIMRCLVILRFYE
ncbi:uncharacterized protein LOC127866999 isoform X2 [Dreissena polymorpha]|uniref:uncharacterized protein LOC127866999 isoform X2 n=1 Tax=Dreissena polymorpha TaxID=45954 RepID=UPI0022646AC8|nr:uncharacterized protein LOC127866999 isoform X2 [Dreissena polymorpha]